MIISSLQAINSFHTIARICLLYIVSLVSSPTIPSLEGDCAIDGNLQPASPLSVTVKDLPNFMAGNAYIKYPLKSSLCNDNKTFSFHLLICAL